MSAYGQPISAARFAAALSDLPLSSLHSKSAEIQNSIIHLRESNAHLQPFVDDGDRDCAEAVAENHAVIDRQMQRIELLKSEVQRRGFRWEDATVAVHAVEDASPSQGAVEDDELAVTRNNDQTRSNGRELGGSIGDDELARRLEERLAENDGGLHL